VSAAAIVGKSCNLFEQNKLIKYSMPTITHHQIILVELWILSTDQRIKALPFPTFSISEQLQNAKKDQQPDWSLLKWFQTILSISLIFFVFLVWSQVCLLCYTYWYFGMKISYDSTHWVIIYDDNLYKWAVWGTTIRVNEKQLSITAPFY
jgi:hypothetical protein